MTYSRRLFAKRLSIVAWVLLMVLSANLGGCTYPMTSGIYTSVVAHSDVAISLSGHALNHQPCSGTFVPMDLPHTTSAAQFNVRGFESNGSGVAAGDLDSDGDLDLVLGGFAQPSTILWNEGNLKFHAKLLGNGLVREVQLVDLDADGDLDIVTSRRGTGLGAWLNSEETPSSSSFLPFVLDGVDQPLYALDWADADGDLDLDLGGATYDAELLAMFGNEFMMNDSGGVYIFLRQATSYRSVQLAQEAQGLAALFFKATGRSLPDLLIGNDFALSDMAFAKVATGWSETQPFANTTHSTMSLAAGDINNDGRPDLMATDMKPPSQEPAVLAAWEPLMASMMADTMEEHDHVQLMENTLQLAGTDGQWDNMGNELDVDATGWSWSGKFGDLDNDGWTDLYIVNGMMEEKLLEHLPHQELVESNVVYRNASGDQAGVPTFKKVPDWNLSSQRSGRGLVMADLDLDGDLDIVVNNMRGAAQLFANELCLGESHFLEIDLRWPDSPNTQAIGATVTALTDVGIVHRQVHVAAGYLSADPPRLHFGLGQTENYVDLTVNWPDGLVSRLYGVPVDGLLQISREE